jgi:hypothetical protein
MKEDPFAPIRGNCDSLHTRHSSTNRSSKHPSFCLYGFTNFDSYKVVLISVLSFMTGPVTLNEKDAAKTVDADSGHSR